MSIGVRANAVDLLERLLARGIVPDVLTDQTSAHDELNGYVPARPLRTRRRCASGRPIPRSTAARSIASMGAHVAAMLELKRRGAVTFDYGNNLARGRGRRPASRTRTTSSGSSRSTSGRSSARARGRSGGPRSPAIPPTSPRRTAPFSSSSRRTPALRRWITLASERVAFQGLPARICWLGYGERAKAGLAFNELVRSGRVKAPIVIGRDHLDCGSVASPNRETEGMKDGSDAIADWPLLNAMLNTAAGATWVSIHHGGGVGIGYSLHAGMVVVADGTDAAAARLERVLTTDPGMGVIRHADAGYPEAVACAEANGIPVPMRR